jgi:hypothetical protein
MLLRRDENAEKNLRINVEKIFFKHVAKFEYLETTLKKY